jgi:hypothetical protein
MPGEFEAKVMRPVRQLLGWTIEENATMVNAAGQERVPQALASHMRDISGIGRSRIAGNDANA